MAKKKKLGIVKKILWALVVVLALVAGAGAYLFYREFLAPNIRVEKPKQPFLYIPTSSKFEDVVKILRDQKFLVDEKTFRWTADRMKYISNVKPGKYLLKPHMNNKA